MKRTCAYYVCDENFNSSNYLKVQIILTPSLFSLVWPRYERHAGKVHARLAGFIYCTIISRRLASPLLNERARICSSPFFLPSSSSQKLYAALQLLLLAPLLKYHSHFPIQFNHLHIFKTRQPMLLQQLMIAN